MGRPSLQKGNDNHVLMPKVLNRMGILRLPPLALMPLLALLLPLAQVHYCSITFDFTSYSERSNQRLD